MATRKKSQSPEPQAPAELLVTRDDARSKIEERIEKGRLLRSTQISSRDALEKTKNEYFKWDKFNAELLRRIFTTEEISEEYSRWFGGVFSTQPQSLSEDITDLYKDIDSKIHRLDSISERLELIPLSIKFQPLAVTNSNSDRTPEKSRKVFVVHGHDEASKTNLEVFLREIGLEPIVLHRQADEGLTIIEKFEKHSDVGYAFILLTPDEIAYLAHEDLEEEEKRHKEFRARPNVIFEFGYFVGKLGRSRVCCLYTGAVTLPSDISGMIYKKFNASVEEVAYGIIKDLKAQGYTVV